MRYCLEFFEDPDMMVVNIDDKVCTKPRYFHFEDDHVSKQPKVVRDLFGIKGVASVGLRPYFIELGKGNACDWSLMISAILFTIHQINYTEEMVEIRRPVKIKFDKNGNTKRKKMKFKKLKPKTPEPGEQ